MPTMPTIPLNRIFFDDTGQPIQTTEFDYPHDEHDRTSEQIVIAKLIAFALEARTASAIRLRCEIFRRGLLAPDTPLKVISKRCGVTLRRAQQTAKDFENLRLELR